MECNSVWLRSIDWLSRSRLFHLFTTKSSLVALAEHLKSFSYIALKTCPMSFDALSWDCYYRHLCIHPAASVSREIIHKCQHNSSTGNHKCPSHKWTALMSDRWGGGFGSWSVHFSLTLIETHFLVSSDHRTLPSPLFTGKNVSLPAPWSTRSLLIPSCQFCQNMQLASWGAQLLRNPDC